MSAGRSELSTARKLLFAAVVTALMLGTCEAALRVRAWIKYGSPSTGVRNPMLTYDRDADVYVPTPGYEVHGSNIHIKINSLGFRGDEFTREKPARTVRIACLGASTTFGAEASSNHTTWPHRLQEKLQAAYPDVKIEVINAAVGGYVASDNLKVLRHRVLPLDPDLVIYYEANNEIVKDTQELAAREGLATNSGPSPMVARLARYSLMFDLAYKNLAILAGGRGTAARKIDRVPVDLPNHFIGELDDMRQAAGRAERAADALDVSREVPARPAAGDADRQRGRGLLLHALDEHRRDARRDGRVQRGDSALRAGTQFAGCRRPGSGTCRTPRITAIACICWTQAPRRWPIGLSGFSAALTSSTDWPKRRGVAGQDVR